jgi:catecholate siderophore receptor
LANVPKQTFNAFITHRLAWRLNAGLGGNYVASRTASSTVPFVPLTFSGPNTNPVTHAVTYTVLSTGMKQVPGYWVFNAMIKRPINDHLDFQINANNVLNRFFIDLPHPSHLIPGEGANVLFGVNFKF